MNNKGANVDEETGLCSGGTRGGSPRPLFLNIL